jgi:hypothetical protein
MNIDLLKAAMTEIKSAKGAYTIILSAEEIKSLQEMIFFVENNELISALINKFVSREP